MGDQPIPTSPTGGGVGNDPILSRLGSRLRRAFTWDESRPDPASPPPRSLSSSELDNILFIAQGAISKAQYPIDYRTSAKSLRSDLLSVKSQLEQVIGDAKHVPTRNEPDWVKVTQTTLAQVNIILGNYSEAEDSFACMARFSRQLGTPAAMAWLRCFEIGWLMEYFTGYLTTDHQLDILEDFFDGWIKDSSTGEWLPENWTADQKCSMLLTRIWLLNLHGQFDKANAWINTIQSPIMLAYELRIQSQLDLLELHHRIPLLTIRAVTKSGLCECATSRLDFKAAFILSGVVFGIWHPRTLTIMHEYGRALSKWGENKAASIILGECCLGRSYRMAPSHPLFLLTYIELERTKDSEEQIEKIQKFIHGVKDTTAMDESRLSTAYEHIYLDTVVDLLVAAGEVSIENVDEVLQTLIELQKSRVDTKEHPAVYGLRLRRAIARCKYLQGNTLEAIADVQGIESSIKRTVEGARQSNLDLIRYYNADKDTRGKAIQLSRDVFFGVETSLNRDQAKAFQRQLTALDCTHFNKEAVTENPLPMEAVENIGTGAYAIVESVKISDRLYARKSIALPRRNQNRVRETIQNEISVIRALSHPHIVQVYFTYEAKSRFAIILEPLAKCDLEVFLDQPDPDAGHNQLIWKWLRCLSDTLAFIHSKGIRHKDIKTRNILVNDGEVVFTDFGSSHAFLDEGTSVTEGPAFGHTLLYCAPEVVSWEKRSRSADVFSLGCVFAEMATALDGRSVADFYDFRCRETTVHSRTETHAYHATLDLVTKWFADSATDEVRALYQMAIAHMLDEDPKARPTASGVSDTISKCFQNCYGESLPICPNCNFRHFEAVSSEDPKTRPTASGVSDTTSKCFQNCNGESLPICPNCNSTHFEAVSEDD